MRSPNRSIWTKNGYKPLCPVCGQAIAYMAPDMHEVFVTRGDVMKNNIDPELVFVRYNCVLVHPGPCHVKAGTKRGQMKCWRQLIKVEGTEPILDWLREISQWFNSTTVTEAINNINSFTEEQYHGQPFQASTIK